MRLYFQTTNWQTHVKIYITKQGTATTAAQVDMAGVSNPITITNFMHQLGHKLCNN